MILPPLGNPNLFRIMVADVFSAVECAAIRAALDPARWRSAGITNAEHPGGTVDLYARSVLSQEVPLRRDGWPLSAVRDVIAEVNSSTWRFDLGGFVAQDYPSVLRYEAGVNDHFHSHNDVGPAHPTRKLSFSVQLCEPDAYRGGELLFDGNARDHHMRQLGAMTIFPSMMFHEVTPIVAGTRDAIVGWVHGETYR